MWWLKAQEHLLDLPLTDLVQIPVPEQNQHIGNWPTSGLRSWWNRPVWTFCWEPEIKVPFSQICLMSDPTQRFHLFWVKSSLVSAVLQPDLVIRQTLKIEIAIAPCSHLRPFPKRLLRCFACFAMGVSGNLDTTVALHFHFAAIFGHSLSELKFCWHVSHTSDHRAMDQRQLLRCGCINWCRIQSDRFSKTTFSANMGPFNQLKPPVFSWTYPTCSYVFDCFWLFLHMFPWFFPMKLLISPGQSSPPRNRWL